MKLLLKSTYLLAMLMALLMLGGCPGGDEVAGVNNQTRAGDGVYVCSYNRAGGTVHVYLNQGTVKIEIIDGADYYDGTGTIDQSGHFKVTCTAVGPKTVSVD